MNNANADPLELEKFSELAHRWWDPQSEFKPLHEINPLRLDYIDGIVKLQQKQILDVGCGGGILAESIGRCDIPHADEARLLRNIRRNLLALPEDTHVLPGHGPPTTIAHERRHNHGSCIIESPRGDLLACWFHGSGERQADDVRIEGARLRRGHTQWSPRFTMAGIWCLAARKALVRLLSSTVCHSASV